MNILSSSNAKDARLSVAERCAYSAGNVGSSFIYAAISTFLLYYYTNIVGLNGGIIGTILLASRVFDGVTDLIMGVIIDRTSSKYGKARIWLLRSCIPYAIASILLFSVPSGWSSAAQYIFVFVTYNLVNSVAYTAISTAYNTMNCLITANQYERGLLGVFAMFGSTFGQMIVNSFTLSIVEKLGGTKTAWTITFSVFALIALGLHLLCVFGTKERVTEAEKNSEQKVPFTTEVKALFHNKYWLMISVSYVLIMVFVGLFSSSLMYYSTYILGSASYQALINNVTMIPQCIALLIAFIFIKKLGKGKTFTLGTFILLLAFVGKLFAGTNYTLQIIMAAVHGFGQGLASSVLLGIIADTVEYGVWKTGFRTTGTAYAVPGFAAKIGSGLGPAIVGWMLAWGGFDSTLAEQSSKTIFSINACYIYIPLILAVIILIIMFFYKLDSEYDTIISSLNNNDSDTKNI